MYGTYHMPSYSCAGQTTAVVVTPATDTTAARCDPHRAHMTVQYTTRLYLHARTGKAGSVVSRAQMPACALIAALICALPSSASPSYMHGNWKDCPGVCLR
jgi:hypothetical protein